MTARRADRDAAADAAVNAAAARTWDALVIGAGPAGSLAAFELARAGLDVLLVDRAAFPRDKACGGCLNATAVACLREAGLPDLLAQAGARPLAAMQLHARGQQARLPLHGGVALSRAALDAALLAAARDAGAAVLTGVRAGAAPDGSPPEARADVRDERADLRAVQLTGDDGLAVRVEARVVLAATGLGPTLLDARAPARPARGSRVGAGTVLEAAGSALPAGELHMVCGERGYVGLVSAERGRLVVAAALDPAAVAEAGGPGPAAATLLARAGLPPLAGLAQARWLGTPPLTRRATTLAARRAFVLGDAAGFVEPFTGEGLAWALTAARAVQPFARAAARAWDDALIAAWSAEWRATVARRQRLCRGLAWTLRHPLAVRAALAALSSRPQLGAPLLSRLGAAVP